jgi:hypothetical protein
MIKKEKNVEDWDVVIFSEENTEENVINETAKADTVYKNMVLCKEIIDRRNRW